MVRTARSVRRILAVAASATLLLAGCAHASEQGGEASAASGSNFYADHNVEITVPFAVGGGNDVIARFLAPKLKDALAGNPTVTISNEPGAGSVTGANNFVLQKAADGTTLLSTSASTLMPWFLGVSSVKYDFATLQPVVGFPTSRVFLVNPATGITTAADLAKPRDTPLVIGGQGPTEKDAVTIIMLEALGVTKNVKFVFGYEGAGDQMLAFGRGELDAVAISTSSYNESAKELQDQGKLVPIMTDGIPDGNGGYKRDPAFPDVPTVAEVYKQIHNGEQPTGDAWNAFAAFNNITSSFNYGMWMQPNAPQERVQEMRDAIAKLMTPDVIKEGQASWGPYDPVVGDDLAKVDELFKNIDQNALTWARDYLNKNYPTEK